MAHEQRLCGVELLEHRRQDLERLIVEDAGVRGRGGGSERP